MKQIIEINFKESDNYTEIKSVIDTLQNNLNTENVDNWFILPKLEFNDCIFEGEHICTVYPTGLTVGVKLMDNSETTIISEDLPYVSRITDIDDDDFIKIFNNILFERFNEYTSNIMEYKHYLEAYISKKCYINDLVMFNISRYSQYENEYPYKTILDNFDKSAHAVAEYKVLENDLLKNHKHYRKNYIKEQEYSLNSLKE